MIRGNFEGVLASALVNIICLYIDTIKINRNTSQLGLCPTTSGAVKIMRMGRVVAQSNSVFFTPDNSPILTRFLVYRGVGGLQKEGFCGIARGLGGMSVIIFSELT